MKRILKLIFIVSAFAILTSNVYAQNVVNRASDNGQNVEIISDTVMGNTDYSDLEVNVIKSKNGNKTIVYSGKLGNYANGAYSYVDFSQIQILMMFHLSDSQDESTYIIPISEYINLNLAETNDFINSQVANNNLNAIENVQNTINIANVKTNVSLMYNDKYYENVLLPGQTLNVPVTITNTNNTSLDIISYVAEYDLSGCLVDVKQGETITVPSNQTINTTLLKEFTSDITGSAKVFLWEKETMQPISENIQISIETQDYYADTYNDAQEIDIEKQVCGVINTDEDVDIIKFTPNTSGVYVLQLQANDGVTCGLYDDDQTILNSISSSESNNYLLYSLEEGQDYYIRFNGTENSNYEITPTKPDDIISVSKNIGELSSLSNNSEFNIYKFDPTAAGNYIITAVDNDNVQADLYSPSFEKIASSSDGDDIVSFRITNEMASNQEYYIVVYPKSDTQLGSYTLYVEEPFTLVSIE